MWGLIKKDLYNLMVFKSQLLIVFAFLIIFGFSMKSTSFIMIYIIIYVGTMTISLMALDDQCGFNKFALTTSLTARQLVGEKYLLMMMLMLFGVLINIIFGAILGIVWGDGGSTFLMTMIESPLFGLLTLGVYSVIIPLQIKLGAEKVRLVLMGIMAVLGACIYIGYSVLDERNISIFDNARGTVVIAVAATIFLVLVVYISSRFAIKNMEKKEW